MWKIAKYGHQLVVPIATDCNTLMKEKETPGVSLIFTLNARGLKPKVKQIVHF